MFRAAHNLEMSATDSVTPMRSAAAGTSRSVADAVTALGNSSPAKKPAAGVRFVKPKNSFGIHNLAQQSIAVALYATRWKAATRTVHKFCTETTAHGVKNIITKSSKAHKIVWAVLFSMAIVACCTHFGLRMKSYQQYRHQELIYTERAEAVLFPDVTICNLTPVKRDKLLQALFLVYKYFELPFFTDPTCADTYYTINYPIEFGDPRAIVRAASGSEISELGFSLEDMLIDCWFGGVKCDADDFQLFIHPIYYNCYTLNISRVIERLRAQTPGVLNSHNARLLLTLFVESFDGTTIRRPPEFTLEEYPWTTGLDYSTDMKTLNSYGVRVHLHNNNVRPTPEQSGFDFSPGFISKVRLQPNLVKREKAPYKSNCTEQDVIEETGSPYSQSECVDVCVQKRVTQRCGCQHVTLPELDGWPRCGTYVCNLTELFCYESIRGSAVYSECVQLCPKSCQEVTYQALTTASYWPSHRSQKDFYRQVASASPYVKQLLGNSTDENLQRLEDMDLIRKNFLQVNVFLKDDYVVHRNEQPQYTPVGLATEFGGTLGLWIGISIVTITELLEFLVSITTRLTATACARCKRR